MGLSKHDTFLLRIDPAILKAVKQWAADELRSANGQIEFLLREALQRSHRLTPRSAGEANGSEGNGADKTNGTALNQTAESSAQAE